MVTQSLKRALLLLLTLCVCVTLSAQETQPVENVISVKLINASTNGIVANASVEVRSNNGRRCVRPPCRTNDLTWSGVSGADGVLRIPSCVIQYYTNIRVAGYLAINFNEARAADGTSVPELSLDTWRVRLAIDREEGRGRNVWLISGSGGIAAGDETNRADLWRAFPCRARLSAENLLRMRAVVAEVNPSAWRSVYGGRSSEVRSRNLNLERAEANGEVRHMVILYRAAVGDMPEDLQALFAATQAVITQTFAEQNCGSSPLLESLNGSAPTTQPYFITTLGDAPQRLP